MSTSEEIAFARLMALGERINSIRGSIDKARAGEKEVAQLVDLIFGWGNDDSKDKMIADQLQSINDGLDEAKSEIDQNRLDSLRDSLAGISGDLDKAETRIHSYLLERQQSPKGNFGSWNFANNSAENFISWYAATGQHIAYDAIYGTSQKYKTLVQILSNEASIGGDTSVFDQIDQAVKAATNAEASVPSKSIFHLSTRYDVYSRIYARFVQLYRHAWYIHDTITSLYCEIVYGNGGDNPGHTSQAWQNAVIKLVGKTMYRNLKSAGWSKHDTAADFFNMFGFAGRIATDNSPLEWEKFMLSPMASMEAQFTADSVYSNDNLQTADWAEAIDPIIQFSIGYGMVNAPDGKNAFITGLRYKSQGTPGDMWPDGGMYRTGQLWLQAHFSTLSANGKFEALGWYPTEPPSNDSFTASPWIVLFGQLDHSTLPGDPLSAANVSSDHLLVMTGAGFCQSGSDASYFGFQGQYAKLVVQADGSGVIEPFTDDAEQGLRQSENKGNNHLTLNAPGSEKFDMLGICGGAAGRLIEKGKPDPSGIITNVMIGRTNTGSGDVLFIRAQVAPRLWALPYFQPEPPAPPVKTEAQPAPLPSGGRAGWRGWQGWQGHGSPS